MSNTKKILSFIFLALLTLVLVGCELPTPSTDTVSRTESEARKDLETASSRLVFTTGELIVERDEIALTTTFASIKEISFTWTSSNETVIKITETEEGLKGVVTRPEDEDVEVTLSCTIAVTYTKADDGTAKKGSVTETKEFVFTVKKIDKGSEASIKVAKTLAKGETVTIEGVVTNVLYTAEFDATKENTVTGIFVSDETDGVYVYSKNGGVTAKVGDKVAITGVVDYYYGAVQISGGSDGSALSIKVVESGQATPAYVSTEKAIAELYEEMVDGITNSKPTVCGSTFEVYAKVVVEVSGSYTNVYLADPYNNNVRFKVYYKTGFECVEGLTGNSMVEALKAFDGKYVRMPIIPYATDSSKAYCACLTAGKIVETGAPTITDEDLANQTKTKAENLSGKYTAGETVALFTTDEATGATVEWTASVEGVIDLTTGLINEAAAEQVITLTAKVTKGTVVVEATVELTIKAKPTEEPTHAGTEEDPYTVSDAVIMASRLDENETGTDMYYVRGEVKSLTEISTQFGNATFVITDGTKDFICYRAKYLNNEKFTAEDQIKVGMVVVVYGKFTNYKGTIEFASGCYIKTIEGLEITDQDKANSMVNGIKVDEVATENFELPVVEGVVWTMKEASTAATLEGNKVTVVRGEADVVVVFVATATVNEATATKKFKVTIKGTTGTTVKPTHAGTAEDPFTVADARLVCNELTDGGYSTEMYYVKGLVTSVSFNSKYSSYTLIVVDSKDSSDSFKFYSSKLAEGVEEPVVGATVVAYGYMQKYVTGSNADLELSGKDGVYPTLSSVVNPAPQPGDENKVTYTIGKSEATITTGEDSTVTIDFGDFEVQLIKNKSTIPPQEPSVEIRVYQNSIFKLVSKSGKKITGFEFTDIHNKKADSIDFSCDDNAAKLSETHVIGGLWQIVASEGLDSISFIASHKQMRLSAITITFE